MQKIALTVLLFVSLFHTPSIIAKAVIPPSQNLTGTIAASQGANVRIQQKRAQVQQQLNGLSNQSNSNKALNIFDRLNSLNTRRTNQLQQALDRMQNILNSLMVKLNAATNSGVDTTNAQAAAVDAQASLDLALGGVASQAAKVYSFDASAGANLKQNTGRQISQLQADFQVLKKLVIDTKQKISKLIRELAKTGVGKIGQGNSPAASDPALFQPLIQP